MFQVKDLFRLLVPVFLSVIIFSGTASAQVSWLQNVGENRVSFEFSKLSLKDPYELDFMSGIFYLSADIRISEQFSLMFDLPYSRVKNDVGLFSSDASSSIGNPLIAGKFGGRGTGGYGYLGIRLPMASDEEYTTAQVSAIAFPDRLEAFVPEIMSYTVVFGYQNIQNTGLRFLVDGGLTLIDPESDFLDNEILLNHKFVLSYDAEKVSFAFGYNGRFNVSDESYYNDNDYASMIGAKIAGKFGRYFPGIHVYVPLDEEATDLINPLFGVNIDVKLDKYFED